MLYSSKSILGGSYSTALQGFYANSIVVIIYLKL